MKSPKKCILVLTLMRKIVNNMTLCSLVQQSVGYVSEIIGAKGAFTFAHTFTLSPHYFFESQLNVFIFDIVWTNYYFWFGQEK